MDDPKTTDPTREWNRECVVCGHKWHGNDIAGCPICIRNGRDERLNTTIRPHIVGGKFQSDKYPTCPPGKVPLSVNDPMAQDLLWEYAQRRREVDAEFSDDLEWALRHAGYTGETIYLCDGTSTSRRADGTMDQALGRLIRDGR